MAGKTSSPSPKLKRPPVHSPISYGPCPLCGRDIGPFPALSRRARRTAICSDCGLLEALEGYKRYGT